MIDLTKATKKLKKTSLPLPDSNIKVSEAMKKSRYLCLSIKNNINYNDVYHTLTNNYYAKWALDGEIINATASFHFLGKGSDLASKEIAKQFGNGITSRIQGLNRTLVLYTAYSELMKEAKDDLIWNESPHAEEFYHICKEAARSKYENITVRAIDIIEYAKDCGTTITPDELVELLRFSFDINLANIVDKELKIAYT